MLIGIENFGGMPDAQFDTRLSPSRFNYIKATECILDEIYADNNVDMPYACDKKEWSLDTVFLGTFDGTLECGNIQNSDQIIDAIRFRKKAEGKTEWVFIEELPYDKAISLYDVKDRLAYSLESYQYAICPVSQGVEGDYITAPMVAEYEGLWVLDRNESHKLFYDLEYGAVTPVVNDIEFELLENEYPMFQSTSANYDKGSCSATIIGDRTGRDGVNIDYLGDRKQVEGLTKFLKNHKPKMLKDGNGLKKIVMTHDVSIKPMKNKLGGVCTVDFKWTEIGDTDSTADLILHGLLPEEAGGLDG